MNTTFNPNKPASPKPEEYEGCPTVGDRATNAEKALKGFTDAIMEPISSYHAKDLIADILHLAHREGWDINQLLESAKTTYEAES